LDEISRALRKQKTVIPVLHLDCDIPLRLERHQHIDFRTDYADGLKTLLRALGVEQQPASHAAAASAAPEQSQPFVLHAGEGQRLEEQEQVQVQPKGSQPPSLLRGLAQLTADIRIAFGPNGQSLPVKTQDGEALLTRDGVAIAREVEPEDP